MPNIDKKTGIALGVVIAILISVATMAYWLGGTVTGIQYDVGHLAIHQAATDKATAEWRNRTTEILDELKLLSTDSKLRLDYVEKAQGLTH